MKKLLVGVILFCSAVIYGAQAQTPACDDLCTALMNHGVDAVSAPVEAAIVEAVVANNNALLKRLADDEASIAALQARVAALCASSSTPCP